MTTTLTKKTLPMGWEEFAGLYRPCQNETREALPGSFMHFVFSTFVPSEVKTVDTMLKVCPRAVWRLYRRELSDGRGAFTLQSLRKREELALKGRGTHVGWVITALAYEEPTPTTYHFTL